MLHTSSDMERKNDRDMKESVVATGIFLIRPWVSVLKADVVIFSRVWTSAEIALKLSESAVAVHSVLQVSGCTQTIRSCDDHQTRGYNQKRSFRTVQPASRRRDTQDDKRDLRKVEPHEKVKTIDNLSHCERQMSHLGNLPFVQLLPSAPPSITPPAMCGKLPRFRRLPLIDAMYEGAQSSLRAVLKISAPLLI